VDVKTKAVVERFEGSTAILSLGEDGKKMEVPRTDLPEGCKEGDWLKVELNGEKLVKTNPDRAETARARKRIEDKMAALLRGEQLK
jgi:hypothetical protein